MNNKAKMFKVSEEQDERIMKVRHSFSKMYDAIDELCKTSRETSLCYTCLEQAQFWAIKGISREEVKK